MSPQIMPVNRKAVGGFWKCGMQIYYLIDRKKIYSAPE
jgi:hypothetical protein